MTKLYNKNIKLKLLQKNKPVKLEATKISFERLNAVIERQKNNLVLGHL